MRPASLLGSPGRKVVGERLQRDGEEGNPDKKETPTRRKPRHRETRHTRFRSYTAYDIAGKPYRSSVAKTAERRGDTHRGTATTPRETPDTHGETPDTRVCGPTRRTTLPASSIELAWNLEGTHPFARRWAPASQGAGRAAVDARHGVGRDELARRLDMDPIDLRLKGVLMGGMDGTPTLGTLRGVSSGDSHLRDSAGRSTRSTSTTTTASWRTPASWTTGCRWRPTCP